MCLLCCTVPLLEDSCHSLHHCENIRYEDSNFLGLYTGSCLELLCTKDEGTVILWDVRNCVFTQWHTRMSQKIWIFSSTDVRTSYIVLSHICFRTLATFASKSTVMSLDWVTKNERYFISGNKQGLVRLYDTRDNRITWELGADAASPLKDARSEIIAFWRKLSQNVGVL